MTKLNLSHRIQKLETATTSAPRLEIPVWCEDRESVPEAVERMVARSQIADADRDRCVYWADWKGATVGTHEAVVLALDSGVTK